MTRVRTRASLPPSSGPASETKSDDGRLRDQAAAERFGRNLWRARRRAGFSQEELGRLASVHRTHIGFMEAGERLPRVDTLVKLTSALAVSADELLQGIILTSGRRGGHAG